MPSDVPPTDLRRAAPTTGSAPQPNKPLPSAAADHDTAGSRMQVCSMASMATVASTDSMASAHGDERPPLGLRTAWANHSSSNMHYGGGAEKRDVESVPPSEDAGPRSSKGEAQHGGDWSPAGSPGGCCVTLSDTDTDPDTAGGTAPAYVSNGINAMTRDIAGGVTEPLLAVSIPSQGITDRITPGSDGAIAAAPAVRAAREEPKQDVVAGMLYYASSSIFFAGMGVTSKMLQDAGYPVWELLFFRALVILTVSMSAILSAGENPFGVRKGLLLLRGTLGYTNIAMFFLACFYLPLATATTFTFFSPLIVAVVSPWLLRETPSRAVAVVIPLCIGGVLLVTQPPALFGSSVKALSAVGVAIGLAQPFFGAAVKMTVRELRRTEATQVIILYLVLCTLAYSLLGCALTWRDLVTPRSWRDVALLVALGACGYCNQLCTTLGLAKAKAASVMSMQYFSLVFSQIAGMLVFGEFTTPVQAAGMVVIVASMLGYLWHEARAAKR